MTVNLLNAFLGGIIIGLAATLMLWLNGRIAGNSGIMAQCFTFQGFKAKEFWRLSYLFGLIAGAFLYNQLFPGTLTLTYNPSLTGLIAAGLLVGYGTRLGGGCTSGHGVCGIARFSVRSIVATATFVATAILTVFIVRLLGGNIWW